MSASDLMHAEAVIKWVDTDLKLLEAEHDQHGHWLDCCVLGRIVSITP